MSAAPAPISGRKIVDHGVAERADSAVALTAMQARDGSNDPHAEQIGHPTATAPFQSDNDSAAQAPEARRGECLLAEPVRLERGTHTSMYKELTVYFEHIAEHPFLPALQREEALDLSQYKGSMIRRQLVDAEYIKLHKVVYRH